MNGISNYDLMASILGAVGPGHRKDIFHVRPRTGKDGNEGRKPDKALKTLAGGYAKLTSGQNDTLYFHAEGSTSANCTDYLSATQTWAHNNTHLIGVSPGGISSRARVAFASAYDTASNLFTLSGEGCVIANMQFFEGVAGTNPTGCFKVTGNRNYIYNCHLAGIGNDANDIANAYSLYLSGSENTFERCVIGLDTISRGSADNSEIVLTGGGARNRFIDCDIITFAGANTHQFVKKAASGIDRFVEFINCRFINCVASTGVSMLEAFDITAGGSPNGLILINNCTLVGAAEWEASAGVSGELYINNGVPDAASGGVAIPVTAAS